MTTTRAADVVVLGATVAGLTAAVQTAASGASVIVLDPNPVSRFGDGILAVGFGPRLREVEVHRGAEAARTVVTEAVSAIEWLQDTLPEYGVVPAERTMLSLAVDGHLAFHLRQEARLLRRGGVVVEFTDAQPLAPVMTRPGLVVAGQAQVDPHHHRDALLRASRAAGVGVRRGVTLGRFQPGRGGWRLSYGDQGTSETVTTPTLLDTIGVAPWAPLTGGRLRVCPVVLAGVGESGLADDLHVLVDTPAALVATLRGHAVLVGHPVRRADEHDAAVSLVAFAGRLGLDVTAVRSRPVETTPDGLPLVGQLPLLPGAWVARGFGLAESTLGTAAGLQLGAALTTGGSLPWSPVRAPAPLAEYRRWNGRHSDPMVGVPRVLKKRGLA